MKTSVLFRLNRIMLLVVACIASTFSLAQSGSQEAAPELEFRNPVLKSGTANKQGAVYRFYNVADGVDAEVKLKKFSRNDIKMTTIDNASLGWDKAFQPEFGLTGTVQPHQHWYVDFEMSFYKAGTNQKQKMSKIVLTTLDVDGDGWSISEYASLFNPTSVTYATISFLQGLTNLVGTIGQTFLCQTCSLPSLLVACSHCGGDGIENNGDYCDDCNASGKLQLLCQHPYLAPSTVEGPIDNFLNIDTLATQVMATYSYEKRDKIVFRYGAKSASHSSNGSGVRMNSMWFKSFNLANAQILPVKISDFSAQLNKKTVTLKWTGYEEDFSHYILQRSEDGKEYKDLGIIWPTNNGNQWNEYGYKDMNVSSPTGMLFYRLQLVDKVDEVTKFSEVRAIRLGRETDKVELVTYPNPVSNDLRITLPSGWQGKASVIELFNASGNVLSSTQIGSSSQTETMDLSKYPRGIYFVKISCNGQTAQQRVIKN